ncbi:MULTISPECIES: hypothetical protein [unclassified Streptomyces]|uniref:hypothetical protein n=1 Tax=unclassified Streptomyces TaxID=2593676 RepID=UPI00125D25D2|nr:MULTISPECIES: hypothetical protein [unclassified Streptomyces]
MATLTVQTIGAGGLSPTYAAADVAGDKLKPGRTTFLHVINADASPITVTIATPGTVSGLAIADRAVTVDASDEQMIPIPADLYGDPADSGLASVSYSSVTSVTVAALRI